MSVATLERWACSALPTTELSAIAQGIGIIVQLKTQPQFSLNLVLTLQCSKHIVSAIRRTEE